MARLTLGLTLIAAGPVAAHAATIVGATSGKALPAGLREPLAKTLASDPTYALPYYATAGVWLEQKLLADDGGYLDAFGWSIAVHGTTAMVGAYYATVGGNPFQGAVYVFEEANGTWTQVQKLTASDGAGGDNFGTSVVFEGDTALIGAPAASIDGPLLEGAAYVFKLENGSWTEVQKLTSPTPVRVEEFGISIAKAGSNALIGAFGASIGGNDGQGAVYAFSESNGSWSMTQMLTASDGAAQDQFGQQLAMDGTTAVIGADQATYANDYPGPGAAYVFTLENGTWVEGPRLMASDGVDADYYGRWTMIQGSTIVVGAPAATVDGNPFQGAVYVYTNSGGTWTEAQKLVADDGAAFDFFGDAVDLSGSTILVGAPGATIGGNPFTGAGYLFAGTDGVWSQTDKLVASDGAYGDEFGYAVALRDGGTAFFGAPHPTDDGSGATGAAYVFTVDTIFASGFDGANP